MKALVNSNYTVTPKELPLSCPPASQKGWDKHPRVFLPLSSSAPRCACPYCGTIYSLEKREDS
ncbi:zinc-finger domain-containing protein [Candidatus Persebacteraceae bacterium Df01]|jgi:uncharacterized Zn-finger protein|uniref:Zinc-finger domain-containing protein n=1 Tax=Candidatus Doriopsillibacter californiensis TaxID=2970740 RepID=A0ABT7QNF6_9GAMM|nr:zinc-finger domain-containing protein [Candidatus Persebacteraceae bacterium Df01]